MRKPKIHALLREQSDSFSALMKAGRRSSGLSMSRIVDTANRILESWGYFDQLMDRQNVYHLENSPPSPFHRPHRISALLYVYGLSWRQVLESIGVDPRVITDPPVKMDQPAGADQWLWMLDKTRHPEQHCYKCGQIPNRIVQIGADQYHLCRHCAISLMEVELRFIGDPETARKVAVYLDSSG